MLAESSMSNIERICPSKTPHFFAFGYTQIPSFQVRRLLPEMLPLIILIGASSPCRPQGSPGRATQPSADKVPVRKMNKLDAVTTTATKDQDSVLKNTDGAAEIDVIDTSATSGN